MIAKLPLITIALSLATAASSALACTGIRLTAEDGSVVVGRTMEFGFDVESDALVVPRGQRVENARKDPRTTFSYETRYGFVAANVLGRKAVVDGVNEAGLYVGAHYFPGYAGYSELTDQNANVAVAPEDCGTWLLSNFATVEEVRDRFEEPVLVANSIEELGGAPFPAHFVVHDASGDSAVIEPIDGKLVLHENPLGVFTNSPSFDWHMTNLSNYVNLRATNVPALELENGVRLTQFGQGTGMMGLPGDFTPPSRFVRAVAYSQTVDRLPTAEDTVLQMFHVMNMFDIPKGAIRDVHGDSVETDYTVWTSVVDLENRRWLFRTYNDQSIRSIDVRRALEAAGDQVRTIEMDSQQAIKDVSDDFE